MTLIYRTGTLVLLASLVVGLSSMKASAAFITDFEAPTYVSGQLVGQDSWEGGTAPRVQTASELATELTAAGLNAANPVNGGDQAVIVTDTGGSSSTIRPITGLETATNIVLDVWARPLTPGAEGSTVGTNLGNIFMTMEDGTTTNGIRAAAFRFGAETDTEGQIISTSIDYASEDMTGLWVPSGTSWEPDTWYNIRMEADYSTKTYDFFIDGTKINDDPITFYDTNSVNMTRVRTFRGSGQAGMIVDDLSVAVPEPSAFVLLLAAGSGMLLTWRK